MKTIKGAFITALFGAILGTGVVAYAGSIYPTPVKPLVKPELSIVHAPTPGYSILVVNWPDGKVEKLVFKDTELNSPYLSQWLVDRYEAYERRTN